MFASEGKALQLKDGMPVGSILHRLSGTENQVLDVTLARLQACDSMHTCSSVVAGVAATREAVFHGDDDDDDDDDYDYDYDYDYADDDGDDDDDYDHDYDYADDDDDDDYDYGHD
jgi:hypothetical protein